MMPRSRAIPTSQRVTAWCLLVAFGACHLLTSAFGQSAAVVDPANAVYDSAPGDTITESLTIRNPGSEQLILRPYLSDWQHGLSGESQFLEAGSLPTSLDGWITFPTDPLSIAADGVTQLPYTITVPADAAPGTHWGVLFVESEPGEPVPGQAAAAFSVRVGHIIYVNVPELRSDGAIIGIFGDPPRTEAAPYGLYVQYANTGNSMQVISGSLTVRDGSGEVVIEIEIPRRVVLPAATRSIGIELVGPLPIGNYTALTVLDYGDAAREVAGVYDFQLTAPLAAPAGVSTETDAEGQDDP